jgi:hypothetical protein
MDQPSHPLRGCVRCWAAQPLGGNQEGASAVERPPPLRARRHAQYGVPPRRADAAGSPHLHYQLAGAALPPPPEPELQLQQQLLPASHNFHWCIGGGVALLLLTAAAIAAWPSEATW